MISYLFGIVVLPGSLRFYLLFCLLGTLQWCAVLPQVVVQTPGYRYVSAVLPFAIAVLVSFLPQPLIVAAFCLWIYQSIDSFRQYYNPTEYFNYHMFHFPGNSSTHVECGAWRMRNGDMLGLWECTRKGLENQPNDYKLNLNAASAMDAMGDKQASLNYLIHARRHMPFGWDEHYRKFETGLIHMDLDVLMAEIREKKSKLPADSRKQLEKLYAVLRG